MWNYSASAAGERKGCGYTPRLRVCSNLSRLFVFSPPLCLLSLYRSCRESRGIEKVLGGEGFPTVGRTTLLFGVRAHARAEGRELSGYLDPPIDLRGTPDGRQRESGDRLLRPPRTPGQALLRHLRPLPLQWRVCLPHPLPTCKSDPQFCLVELYLKYIHGLKKYDPTFKPVRVRVNPLNFVNPFNHSCGLGCC